MPKKFLDWSIIKRDTIVPLILRLSRIYLACWKSFVLRILSIRRTIVSFLILAQSKHFFNKSPYLSITNYKKVLNSKSEPKNSHPCVPLNTSPEHDNNTVYQKQKLSYWCMSLKIKIKNVNISNGFIHLLFLPKL